MYRHRLKHKIERAIYYPIHLIHLCGLQNTNQIFPSRNMNINIEIHTIKKYEEITKCSR